MSQDSAWRRNWHPSALLAALFIGLVAGGITWWAQVRVENRGELPPDGVTAFVGGCEPFAVHAQNRWEPIGAKSRRAPFREAPDVASYAPNELIAVDGWVRTRAGYPSNTAPWNSDVWFHVADNSGWVAFAAVRADPTTFDPTGLDPDGGRPVPATEDCSGTTR